MQVELYIQGQLYRKWEFDLAVYYEPQCKVNHEEKKVLWQRIIETCKNDVQTVICNNPYEFHMVIPARVQPADIGSDEQEKFLQEIIEHKSSSI